MNESAENYLETILLLSRGNTNIRAIDIANELGYSKPSVSRALHLLESKGMLNIDDGRIVLTDSGYHKALAVLDRHETITRFLMMTTDVSKEIAEKDACQMEHFLSKEVYEGIKLFIKQVEDFNE